MHALVSLVVVLLAAVAIFFFVNRPQHVIIEAPLPENFPGAGFSHAIFEQLLQQFVSVEGSVDYERWHSSVDAVAKLNSYLAAVSRYSPDNAPDRFADRNAELAYWMYAYNAYVIKSVIDHWPIESVTDIKAPLEAVKGLGFFYRIRYAFGGEYLSLRAVENDRIRKRYQDPRIHFVLSCASDSCPIVRPELPTGAALDTLLTAAASEFVTDPNNVSVHHETRQIVLSTIFKWYRKDFVNYSRLHGLPTAENAVEYIRSIAPDSLARELSQAADYEIIYRDYDWSLNAAG